MNSKILLSLLCVLFLFSCKKEHQEEKEAPRYPVRFDLTGFTQTQEPLDGMPIKTNSLTTNTTTDTLPVSKVYYYVFDGSNGNIVAQRIVNKIDGSFGVFADNLPAGNYGIYFWGTSIDLKPDNGYFMVFNPDNNVWGETFFKNINVTVTNSGINQTVQMDRVSAQLVVNIEDAIPANVSKIEMIYEEKYQGLGVRGITAWNYKSQNVVNKLLNSTDVGKVNVKLYAHTVSTKIPVNVSISYYTTGTSPYETKKITVTSQPNKITLISGKLFTNNGTFDVSYNTGWNTPVTVGF